MSAQAPNHQHAAGRCTGPRTQHGKNTSRWNSFKHGLYAKLLVLPGEDPADLEALRSSLRVEHQPVNTTEEILVNEIAEHFWRLRRMRKFEAFAMQPDNFDPFFANGMLALLARQMASAKRGMHKAIATLRRLQLDRGFVPSKIAEAAQAVAAEPEPTPQNDPVQEFIPQPGSEYLDFVPEDFDDEPSFPPHFRENAA